MSLIGIMENSSSFTRFRARIVADFRNTRFTWGGLGRWTAIVIAALLCAAVITLYFLDWNQMRGPIARYVSARAGREVRIDGALKVDLFRWQPRVEVGGLYVGNPSWVSQPQGAAIKKGVVEFRLLPALVGKLILPLVELDQADFLVVRDASGRTNWDRDPKGAAANWRIPPINRFLVRDGHLEVDDAVRGLKFLGTIASREEAGTASGNAFQLKGTGTLNGNKFLANVHGGPLINVDESRPYAFAAEITDGDTHAALNGSILHPFHLDRFSAAISFSGSNLSDLYYLTGLALPRSPPYGIAAQLTRDVALYRLDNLVGTVGASDLHGNLTVDVAGTKPSLRGSLISRVLDFSDLGAIIGGGKWVPSAGLLPDTVLHTERLNQMNADVAYAADSIRSQDFPLRGLVTHVVLQDGVLDLKPLSLAFSQGKLSGALKIDARQAVPVTTVDARITDIHMENFVKGAEKPVSGMVEARAVLTGRGNTVHKVAASASGTATAVIPSGRIRHSLAEWMGINVLSALSLTLAGDQSDTGLRCGVVHFSASNGLLTSQSFIFDTDPVLVEGSGTLNLADETLDMRLQGKPKHFQFFRLRAPISISGKLDHPRLGVDAKPLVTQGALGAGLAVVNPLAAIFAFLDPGLAKDANCAGLIGTARAEGAPVKGKS
jgi:AsmA family protein